MYLLIVFISLVDRSVSSIYYTLFITIDVMRTCKGQVDVELDWAAVGVETGAALSPYFLMT